jgi:hypothetical protein
LRMHKKISKCYPQHHFGVMLQEVWPPFTGPITSAFLLGIWWPVFHKPLQIPFVLLSSLLCASAGLQLGLPMKSVSWGPEQRGRYRWTFSPWVPLHRVSMAWVKACCSQAALRRAITVCLYFLFSRFW